MAETAKEKIKIGAIFTYIRLIVCCLDKTGVHMKKLKEYLWKLFLLLIMLFCFYSFYKGASNLLKPLWPLFKWTEINGFAIVFSFGASWFIYQGYMHINFSCAKYPNIIINLEKYFEIIDKVRDKMDDDEFEDESLSGFDEIGAIEALIEDYILYFSKESPDSETATNLLPRVRRENYDYFRFLNKLRFF
jgi:hypothetical protein